MPTRVLYIMMYRDSSGSRPILKVKKVLVLAPNIFGTSGDAINEKQFMKYLCRERYCVVITPVPLSKLSKLGDYIVGLYTETGIKNLALIPLPIVVSYILALIEIILITPFIWLIDKLIRFDLIYVRSSPLALGFLPIKSLSRKTCVKITDIREEEVIRLKKLVSSIYMFADRYTLAKASVIGVPSPILLKELVRRRKTLPQGKFVLLPPGIDKEKIYKIRRANLKSKGCSNYYAIGFLGTLTWWQGVHIIIKAIAKLKDALDKPVTLLIIGDGPEKGNIQKLCKNLKVNCQITGFISHENALKKLSMIDILLVPRIRFLSTESNIPIKVIEAWALGVPVVVTKHKIFEYLGLKDGEHIVYCEPDPDDVAEKTLMVLNNEVIRRKLSENGSLLASSFFYDEIVLKLLKALCEETK